jgi:hypothetical protein
MLFNCNAADTTTISIPPLPELFLTCISRFEKYHYLRAIYYVDYHKHKISLSILFHQHNNEYPCDSSLKFS